MGCADAVRWNAARVASATSAADWPRFLAMWTIRIVVSDCNSLNEQSFKICREDSLSGKNTFYKNVTGNNLMMNLYFSACLNAQNCSLIFFIFSKVFFRDGHDKLALTLNLFFIAFSAYFRTLIFPRSLLSCRLYHTYSHALTRRLTVLKFIWNFNVFDWRNRW